MMMKTSTKGQVVIPAYLRYKYGIKPGTEVEILDTEGKIVIFPAMKNPVEEACGILKGTTSLTKSLLKSRKEDLVCEERKVAESREVYKKRKSRKRRI